MSSKITQPCFLILCLLMQSCSGGRVAEFLDNSFYSDVKDESSKLPNSSKVSTGKKLETSQSTTKNKNNRFESNLSNDKQDNKLNTKTIANLQTFNSEKDENNNNLGKNNKFGLNSKRNKKIINPKTYKITVILKDVDPTSPVENFTNVLRESRINFEIERIEIYPNQNRRKGTNDDDK